MRCVHTKQEEKEEMAYTNAVANNIAAIRAARKEGAALRVAKAAARAQMIVQPIAIEVEPVPPPPVLTVDLLTEEKTLEEKYAVLNTLTVEQYIRWLKKNIRKFGRRAEFGNGRQNAVELFVQDVTDVEITFTASGEITINGEIDMALSGWSDIAYYTYEYPNGDENEEPVFVTTFGAALKYAEYQSNQPFVVDWNFQD
jgi:hypothetical protein